MSHLSAVLSQRQIAAVGSQPVDIVPHTDIVQRLADVDSHTDIVSQLAADVSQLAADVSQLADAVSQLADAVLHIAERALRQIAVELHIVVVLQS